MSDPILNRCVDEYITSPGSPAERMGAVFEYLADELIRDAFPYDPCGSSDLFVDALKLKDRLLRAVRNHSESRTASYESDLAKLKGEVPPRIPKTSNLQSNQARFCSSC